MNGVSQGVTLHGQPSMATGGMEPQFAVAPGDVVAQVHMVGKSLNVFTGRAYAAGFTERGELLVAPQTAIGARNEHAWVQCRLGKGPWPFSSTMRPAVNRSRRYAAAFSWECPVTSKCAKHQPEAGVALKPP